MRYLLLMYGDEQVWDQADPDQREEWIEAHRRFDAAVQERATMVAGEALAPADTTTTLQPRGEEGRRPVTDGPYAETVEQMGGFYLVDTTDLDTMIDLCHELPAYYRLEIRPAVQVADL